MNSLPEHLIKWLKCLPEYEVGRILVVWSAALLGCHNNRHIVESWTWIFQLLPEKWNVCHRIIFQCLLGWIFLICSWRFGRFDMDFTDDNIFVRCFTKGLLKRKFYQSYQWTAILEEHTAWWRCVYILKNVSEEFVCPHSACYTTPNNVLLVSLLKKHQQKFALLS